MVGTSLGEESTCVAPSMPEWFILPKAKSGIKGNTKPQATIEMGLGLGEPGEATQYVNEKAERLEDSL